MTKLTLKEFSLGITDDIVDADPRSAQKADNLLLNRQGHLYQRPGLVCWDTSAPRIPPGNQRVDSIFTFDSTVFVKSGLKLYYIDSTADIPAWAELQTLSSKSAFGDSVLGAGVSWSTWRGHVFATPLPYTGAKSGCRTIKIYREPTLGAWNCEQAGIPTAADAGFGQAQLVSLGTMHEYIAVNCLVHKHSALVDGVETDFLLYGTPGISGVRSVEPDAGTPFAISHAIPINWANGTLDNYTDTATGNSTLRVAGYRTKSDDSVLFFSANNAQGSEISFNINDDGIGQAAVDTAGKGDAPEFYMNGGRKENGPIPLCLYSLLLDGYAFYGAYVDPTADDTMYHNRLVQSNPAIPEGVYYGNFTEFEGLMRGLSSVGSYPIIITSLGARRVEGRFDAFGGGGMKTYLIPESEPGISGKAVVRLDDAIIYASDQGWIWTNGFVAKNISRHLNETYGTLETTTNMSACYDSKNQHVFFAVSDPSADSSGVNNRCFVIDMKSSSPERGVFTTMTSQAQPNALTFDRTNGQVLIGDQRGYVFTLDEETYSDVKVANGSMTGTTVGIVWDFISAGLSSDPSSESMTSKVYGTFKRITGNLSAQFSTIKNFDLESVSKVIRDRAKTGIHKVERWVSGGRWATYQQVRVKKAEVFIANSDTYGTANTFLSGLTIELSESDWPLDEDGVSHVGSNIYFDFDNYDTGFEISVQAGNVLTVLDPSGYMENHFNAEWAIKGVPKNEGVEIMSLGIEVEDEGDANNNYKLGDDGANNP